MARRNQAGTTVLVADKLGRTGIGLDLKFDYCRMAHKRIYSDAPLLVATAIKKGDSAMATPPLGKSILGQL